VIRRLVALAALLAAGLLAAGATSAAVADDPPAQEAGGYIACVYKHTPVDFGLCVSSPL
jgi:hypothetical protein